MFEKIKTDIYVGSPEIVYQPFFVCAFIWVCALKIHLFTFGVECILMSARADARIHDEKLFWLIELGVLCVVFTGNGI